MDNTASRVELSKARRIEGSIGTSLFLCDALFYSVCYCCILSVQAETDPHGLC